MSQKVSNKRPMPRRSQKKEGKKELKEFGSKPQKARPSKGVAIAYANQQETRSAQISRTAQSFCVKHRELVDTILGTTAFNAIRYRLNPGLANLFEWLAPQAAQWEQYRFKYLRFHYIPRCATTKVGSVMLVPEYDALDSPPSSEKDASSYMGAVEGSAWEDHQMAFSVPSMFASGNRKFVRSGTVRGSDLRLFDAGQFFLVTIGQDNTDAIGKLWVEYEVEFFQPQVSSSQNPQEPTQTSNYSRLAGQVLVSAAPTDIIFDTVSDDSLGLGVPAASFVVPKGTYIVYANASVFDDTVENFISQIEILKNGTLIPGGASHSQTGGVAGSFSVEALSAIGFFSSDGTDLLAINMTLTGAAGTLAILANTASLTLLAA